MNSKILVVYKGKTGFTKRYAEMIAEEIDCVLMDYKSITAAAMSEFEIVVFGSRAHAGMIDGYKKVRKMFQESTAPKFVLFVTGATPNTAEEVIKGFWKQNLSADELENIPHFYMQSGLNYEKMSLPDKAMMKMAAAMIKKKKEKSSYDREFEQAITSSYDISSKEYIKPLISFLRS